MSERIIKSSLDFTLPGQVKEPLKFFPKVGVLSVDGRDHLKLIYESTIIG